MNRWLAILLACTMSSVALAGCAEPTADDGGDPGDAGNGPNNDPGASGNEGDETGDDPGSGGETQDNAPYWAAFDYQQEITPTNGEPGALASYSWRSATWDDDEWRNVTVNVEYMGRVTEPIRTQKIDMESGGYQPETVTNEATVDKLKHTFTLQRDDMDGAQPGTTSTVYVYVPVDLYETNAFSFFFSKLERVDDAGDPVAVMEFYLTEEMRSEMEDGKVMYSPYAEGGSGSWWGSDAISSAFALAQWTGYVHGEEGLEERSDQGPYGGSSTERVTYTAGDVELDAWRIENWAHMNNERAEHVLIVSDDTPVPLYMHVSSENERDGHRTRHGMTYELTDLQLA